MLVCFVYSHYSLALDSTKFFNSLILILEVGDLIQLVAFED